MFLSVIIPVFNAEKYLSECLDSLLVQDINRDDYEIICVNDGSTDRSLEILREYETKYANILVLDQCNKGICQARNAGFERAQGDYVWFFDSDDFVQDSAFGKLKNITAQSHCDMLTVGCYTFFETLSEEEQELKKDNQIKENLFGNDVYVILHLFRTSFLRDNGLGFNYVRLKYSEDTIFVYEAKRKNPKRERASEVIYYYRRNSNSTTLRKMASNTPRVLSPLYAARIAKGYYDKGERNTDTANIWMSGLWGGLQQLSLRSNKDINYALRRLREKKEWPVKRPPECTLTKSYMTTRTDFYGKVYDWIYMHQHTYLGFQLMRIYNVLRNCMLRYKRRCLTERDNSNYE